MGKKVEAWIGVDPGVTGAAVLLDQGRNIVDCYDWSGLNDAKFKLLSWVNSYDVQVAGVEAVAMYPGKNGRLRSITAANKLMLNRGQWEGLIEGIGVPVINIAPRSWQKARALYVRKSDNNKKMSLVAARAKWPDTVFFRLEKHHNRAEAAWIAYFAAGYTRAKVDFIRKVGGMV